jgi:hypothetical protein
VGGARQLEVDFYCDPDAGVPQYTAVGEDTGRGVYILEIYSKWACKQFANGKSCKGGASPGKRERGGTFSGSSARSMCEHSIACAEMSGLTARLAVDEKTKAISSGLVSWLVGVLFLFVCFLFLWFFVVIFFWGGAALDCRR